MPKEARDSAALLASKVYYFLGEYVESLSFALGAGNAFEAESRVSGSEEYVETVMCEWSSYEHLRPGLLAICCKQWQLTNISNCALKNKAMASRTKSIHASNVS